MTGTGTATREKAIQELSVHHAALFHELHSNDGVVAQTRSPVFRISWRGKGAGVHNYRHLILSIESARLRAKVKNAGAGISARPPSPRYRLLPNGEIKFK